MDIFKLPSMNLYIIYYFHTFFFYNLEPTSVLSRSVAFDLNSDISEEAEENKPPTVPVCNSASPPPDTKSPTQIQIHRQKKVTPIPRQVRSTFFIYFKDI